MKKISFQVAMKQEAAPLIDALHLESDGFLDDELSIPLYRGRYGELEISLVLQGTDPVAQVEQIGLEAASIATYLICSREQPDLLINFGTAGAFKSRGADIADIYFASGRIYFNDRRVPLPGYYENQRGGYPCLDVSRISTELGYRTGTLSSGSSLEASARDREIMEEQGADVVDMEAAAIAWVCSRKKVPCLFIKGVTDLVDLPVEPGVQFLENLERCGVQLREAVMRVVCWLEKGPGFLPNQEVVNGSIRQ